MIIRKPVGSDAQELLALFVKLDAETQFMLYEPGERTTTVAQQRDSILDFFESQFKEMLIAVDDESGEIAGFTVGIGSELARKKHTLYTVIGVKQAFKGQGVGKQLLTALETWALEHGIHRLELTVMKHNERAIRLYQSMGFEKEGVKQHSMLIDGMFVSELYMSKLI